LQFLIDNSRRVSDTLENSIGGESDGERSSKTSDGDYFKFNIGVNLGAVIHDAGSRGASAAN